MASRKSRFVYETPIRRHERDALAKAAAQAVERAARWTGDYNLGHAFRVIDSTYSVVIDADREEYGTNTQLEIVAFPITKRTENGFRIRLGGWDHAPVTTWVAFRHTKQFAGLTPEDAVTSYVARRRKQARIYERRAAKALALVEQAERLIGTTEETIL